MNRKYEWGMTTRSKYRHFKWNRRTKSCHILAGYSIETRWCLFISGRLPHTRTSMYTFSYRFDENGLESKSLVVWSFFMTNWKTEKKNQQQIASRVLSTSSNKLRGGVCPFNYNILVYVNGDVLVINSWIFNPHICGVARVGIPCSDRRAAVSTRRRNVSVRGKSAETMSNLLTESKGKYWK